MTMTVYDNGLMRGRRGFTLLELLVVITIIVILIAMVTTSGMLVIGRQNEATTRGIVTSLDRALEEYVIEAGAFPSFVAPAYERVPGRKVVTGGVDNLNEMYLDRPQVRHPDASVFLLQAQGIGQVGSIISNIGDRFTVTTELTDSNPADLTNEMDTTPSIVDAWGDKEGWIATSRAGDDDEAWPILHPAAHLIFYVHPSNRLAQDLYGRCVSGRPYFFSAGADGLYGTTSQFSDDGTPNQSGVGADVSGDTLTYSELAVEALEDNIYSYDVDPARQDMNFNGTMR